MGLVLGLPHLNPSSTSQLCVYFLGSKFILCRLLRGAFEKCLQTDSTIFMLCENNPIQNTYSTLFPAFLVKFSLRAQCCTAH